MSIPRLVCGTSFYEVALTGHPGVPMLESNGELLGLETAKARRMDLSGTVWRELCRYFEGKREQEDCLLRSLACARSSRGWFEVATHGYFAPHACVCTGAASLVER